MRLSKKEKGDDTMKKVNGKLQKMTFLQLLDEWYKRLHNKSGDFRMVQEVNEEIKKRDTEELYIKAVTEQKRRKGLRKGFFDRVIKKGNKGK